MRIFGLLVGDKGIFDLPVGISEGEGLRGEAPAELLSLSGRSKSGLTTREGVAETLHPCPALAGAFVVVVPVIGGGRRLRINGTSSSSSSSLDDSCTTKGRALGPGFTVLIFLETRQNGSPGRSTSSSLRLVCPRGGSCPGSFLRCVLSCSGYTLPPHFYRFLLLFSRFLPG